MGKNKAYSTVIIPTEMLPPATTPPCIGACDTSLNIVNIYVKIGAP